MSITSAIVLYAVLWFLILLIALPIGVKTQADTGRVEPGTPASAPDEPMIGRKMRWATLGAAVGWLILYVLIEGRIITHETIRHLAPFDS